MVHQAVQGSAKAPKITKTLNVCKKLHNSTYFLLKTMFAKICGQNVLHKALNGSRNLHGLMILWRILATKPSWTKSFVSAMIFCFDFPYARKNWFDTNSWQRVKSIWEPIYREAVAISAKKIKNEKKTRPALITGCEFSVLRRPAEWNHCWYVTEAS